MQKIMMQYHIHSPNICRTECKYVSFCYFVVVVIVFHFNVKVINSVTNKQAPSHTPPKKKQQNKTLKGVFELMVWGVLQPSLQLEWEASKHIESTALFPFWVWISPGLLLSTFRVGLPSSIKPFYKHPGRHTQKCHPLVIQWSLQWISPESGPVFKFLLKQPRPDPA